MRYRCSTVFPILPYTRSDSNCMEEIIFILIEVFGELVLQILAELFIEGSMTGLRSSLRKFKKRNPVVVWFFYVSLGAGLGLTSLFIFPDHFIKNPALRIVNLIVTPVLAGLLMSLVGHLRRRRGQDPIQLDRFLYGFSFAAAMAFVRLIGG